MTFTMVTAPDGMVAPEPPAPTDLHKAFLKDWAERIVRTFLGAIAAYASSISLTNLNWDTSKAFLLAGIAAGISAVLGLIGRGFGSRGSAGIVGGLNEL
jgi:hypothetical protein